MTTWAFKYPSNHQLRNLVIAIDAEDEWKAARKLTKLKGFSGWALVEKYHPAKHPKVSKIG